MKKQLSNIETYQDIHIAGLGKNCNAVCKHLKNVATEKGRVVCNQEYQNDRKKQNTILLPRKKKKEKEEKEKKKGRGEFVEYPSRQSIGSLNPKDIWKDNEPNIWAHTVGNVSLWH